MLQLINGCYREKLCLGAKISKCLVFLCLLGLSIKEQTLYSQPTSKNETACIEQGLSSPKAKGLNKLLNVAKSCGTQIAKKAIEDKVIELLDLNHGLYLSTHDRSLSSLQRQNAQKAKEIFNNPSNQAITEQLVELSNNNLTYNRSQTPSSIQIKELLNSLNDKFPVLNEKNIALFAQAVESIIDSINARSASKEIGYDAITILPHQRLKLFFTGFCLNAHIPAPKKGEPLQLIPIKNYFGFNEASNLYKSLVTNYISNKDIKGYTQGFIWKVVDGIYPNINAKSLVRTPALLLNSNQPQVSDNILTNETIEVDRFLINRQASFSTYLNSAYRQFGEKKINRIIDGLFGTQQNNYTSYSSTNEVDQILNNLFSQTAEGTVDSLSAYTLLKPNVAAKSYADEHLGISIQIINNSDSIYLYNPIDYVGFSTKVTQPIGGIRITDYDIFYEYIKALLDKYRNYLQYINTGVDIVLFLSEGGILLKYSGELTLKYIIKKYAKEVVIENEGRGIIVLGKYPEYVNLAEEIQADKFNIEASIYEGMSAEEQWAANVEFLDDAISKNKIIRLSSNGNSAIPGTTFYKEVQYLKIKGYKMYEDNSGFFMSK